MIFALYIALSKGFLLPVGGEVVLQTGHGKSPVVRLAVAPNGRVASLDSDRIACVWDSLGRQVYRTPFPPFDPADAQGMRLALDETGRYLAVTEWHPVPTISSPDTSENSRKVPAWAISLYDTFQPLRRAPVCRFTGWRANLASEGSTCFVALELIGRPDAQAEHPWQSLTIAALAFPGPQSRSAGGPLLLRCDAATEDTTAAGGEIIRTVAIGKLTDKEKGTRVGVGDYAAAMCKEPRSGKLVWLKLPVLFRATGGPEIWRLDEGGPTKLADIEWPAELSLPIVKRSENGKASLDYYRASCSVDTRRLLLATEKTYAVFEAARGTAKAVLWRATGEDSQPQWQLEGKNPIGDAVLSPSGNAIAFARDLQGTDRTGAIELVSVDERAVPVRIATTSRSLSGQAGANARVLRWRAVGDQAELIGGLSSSQLVAWWMKDDTLSEAKVLAATPVRTLTNVAVSPDGTLLAFAGWDASIFGFDLRTGRPTAIAPPTIRFEGVLGRVEQATRASRIAFSTTGRLLAYGTDIGPPALGGVSFPATGSEAFRLLEQEFPVGFFDEDLVSARGANGGHEIAVYKRDGKHVLKTVPKGRGFAVVLGSRLRYLTFDSGLPSLEIHELTNAGEERAWKLPRLAELPWAAEIAGLTASSFSSDGATLLTVFELRSGGGAGEPSPGTEHSGSAYALWSLPEGQLLREGRNFGEDQALQPAGCATEGKWLLIARKDGIIEAHRTDSDKRFDLRTGEGEIAQVRPFRTAAGRDCILAALSSGRICFWGVSDLARGLNEPLGALLLLENGDWAFVDREMAFDAPKTGDVNGIHWVVDGRASRLDELTLGQYHPGLFADSLAGNSVRDEDQRVGNHGPVQPREWLDEPDRAPAGATLWCEGPDNKTLVARLTGEGSPPAEADLLVNGLSRYQLTDEELRKLPTEGFRIALDDPRIRGVIGSIDEARVGLVTWSRPSVEPGAIPNYGQPWSRNRDEARGAPTDATRRPPTSSANPKVFALLVGCDAYAGRPLSAAVADAKAIGHLLAGRATPRGQVISLLGEAGKEALGKQDVEQALANLSRVIAETQDLSADDLVLLFFAGHGSYQDQYRYLLPKSGEALDWSLLQGFFDRLIKLPVVPRVAVILDTCSSGAALNELMRQAAPLEQSAKRLGVSLLSATRDEQGAALEWRSLGHGLLTYCLLDAIQTVSMAEEPQADGLRTLNMSDCFVSNQGAVTCFSLMTQTLGFSPAAYGNDYRPLWLGRAEKKHVASLLEDSPAITVYASAAEVNGYRVEGRWFGALCDELKKQSHLGSTQRQFILHPADEKPEDRPRPGVNLHIRLEGKETAQRITSVFLRWIDPVGPETDLESAQFSTTSPSEQELLNWFLQRLPNAKPPKPPSAFEMATSDPFPGLGLCFGRAR